MSRSVFRQSVSSLAIGSLLALSGAVCAPAAAESRAVVFDIPAGPLDAALQALVRQSRLQLVYDADTVRGRSAPALRARLTPEQALSRLTAGGGLVVTQVQAGTFVLKPAPIAARFVGDGRGTGGILGGSVAVQAAEAALAAQAPVELEELVVTGSLIRGAPPSSPIVVLDRQALDRSGKASVADLLADLPQNFASQASADSALIGTDGLGTNDSVAKGVNLRGLGATATLVLVNGRRMAGTGLKGDFADVSAIPTAAVERVEVLLDGASAIYGSDAVGGVVNIILRRDFSGAESRVRVGGAAGGAEQVQLSQALGRAWDDGHIMVAYEYQRDGALEASKRAYTANADLRALGGTDRRQFYSHPGNILGFDPVAGAYVPTFAVPAGQNGVGLTPASFVAGSGNLENQRLGAQLSPRQTRHALVLDASQALGETVTLAVEGRYSRRDTDLRYPNAATIFLVSAANPYFVSPTGSPFELIGYSFNDELGPVRSSGRSESLGLSAGLDARLGRGWRGEVYGAFAQEKSRRRSVNNLNNGFLEEALGNAPDDPLTGYVAARDGYFNPFGDGGANSRALLDFVGSGVESSRSLSRVATLNVKADGDLFDLPGGAVKAAVGGQIRQERFRTSLVSGLSGSTPYVVPGQSFVRDIRAAFAEVRVPVVGAINARPGVERLELSLAGRVEDYDDAGTTANPKIGVLWSPVTGLDLRGTYGKSFRAPALTEVNATQVIGAALLLGPGGQTLSLLQYGGNPDLKPETARSWTFGFDWKPAGVSGLKVSATAFDVAFKNRIGQPVLENIATALTDPTFSPFVDLVNPSSSAADLAAVQALVDRSTSATVKLYPPTAFGAIVDARSVNAASLRVTGVDLSVDYGLVRGADAFDVGLNATYLDRYRRRLTPTAPGVNLVDTAGQPVDLRARVSGGWRRGPYGVQAALNYVDDYAAGGKSVEAWTTFDLNLVWTSAATSGPGEGLVVALSAQNLFDTDPPFYDAPQAVGYDPANADPLGRFVALQLTKRW